MFSMKDKSMSLSGEKPRAPKFLIVGYMIIWMIGIVSMYSLTN
jgi:hypothetical protein